MATGLSLEWLYGQKSELKSVRFALPTTLDSFSLWIAVLLRQLSRSSVDTRRSIFDVQRCRDLALQKATLTLGCLFLHVSVVLVTMCLV